MIEWHRINQQRSRIEASKRWSKYAFSTYPVHVGAAAGGARVRGMARSACHAWAAVGDGWSEVLVAAAEHTQGSVGENERCKGTNEHGVSIMVRYQGQVCTSTDRCELRIPYYFRPVLARPHVGRGAGATIFLRQRVANEQRSMRSWTCSAATTMPITSTAHHQQLSLSLIHI